MTVAGKSVVTVVVDVVDVIDAILDDKDTTSPTGVGSVAVDECMGTVGCEVSVGCVVPGVQKVLLTTVVMVVVVDALTEAGDVVSVVTTLSSSPPSPLMLKQQIPSSTFLYNQNEGITKFKVS